MQAIRQERRLATLLFTDLTDSTALAAGLEPEQFAEVIERIRAIAQRVIPAHGGDILRLDGDGMLCLFGYPDVHEDAGRRATEAALDMHAGMGTIAAAFATPDLALKLHSGIHAGLVLVREGDVVRGKYEVLGDATNIAARLCDAAAPGEILVSAETLGSEQHFFTIAYTRPITPSGHRSALTCLSVTGRAGVGRRFEARERAGLTPFQGRDDEFGHFAHWLATPSEGPAVLGIHGPAGIGKSRFLSRIAAHAATLGWNVAQGYCEAYLSARPLQAFQQAAASLQPPGAAPIIDPQQLAAALQGRRLLLVIDDWQWTDDASRDFLAALLRDGDPARLRCVLASREAAFGLPETAALTSLALAPLGRDATLGAIEQLLASPDPFVVERIERASGGSPLLIEELCHAFATGTDTPDRDPRGVWFDQAVQSRFDRLVLADRELLKLSAVIGHIIPGWLIETLLGAPIDASQLDRLQSADFLFAGDTPGTYRFKHGLTRDALYAGLGRDTRRSLHAEVLAALENVATERGREALLDPLAFHAVAAGLGERGMDYAIAAGDAALTAGALDRAQAHYLAAIDLIAGLRSPAARRDAAWIVLNKFGLACIVDPAPDQLAVLERLAAELRAHGDDRDQQRAEYWLGSIAYGVGLGRRSVRHIEAALHRAEAAERSEDIPRIRIKLTQSLFSSGRVAEAITRFEADLPGLATASSRNERELGAYAHAVFAFLNAQCGHHARADSLFEAADRILDDPTSAINSSILLYRSAALVTRGAWAEAASAAEAVRAVSHRSRARMQNRTSRAQAAYVRWRMGGDRRDAATLEAVAREFLAGGQSRQYVSMVFGWVVEAMAETDQIALARAYMGQVLARARETGDRLGEAMGWRAMARSAQALGDIARADRYLGFARRAAATMVSASEAAHNDLCAADLLAARDQPDEAERLRTAASAALAEMGMNGFTTR
jgi:class 3 adenylate cyclase